MDRITRYYKVKNKGANDFLKAEVYYSLGGMNYFTNKTEDRGYYISVCPVERKTDSYGIVESYTAFTGAKMLILPVTRQSSKKMTKAVELFETRIEDFIKNYFSEYEVDFAA